jgi:hypothetical protein
MYECRVTPGTASDSEWKGNPFFLSRNHFVSQKSHQSMPMTVWHSTFFICWQGKISRAMTNNTQIYWWKVGFLRSVGAPEPWNTSSARHLIPNKVNGTPLSRAHAFSQMVICSTVSLKSCESQVWVPEGLIRWWSVALFPWNRDNPSLWTWASHRRPLTAVHISYTSW